MSNTPRGRKRERERARRRRRDEAHREQLATTGRERVTGLISTLGKRTLAAAQALPQRPQPADLQTLSRQLLEAIKTDLGEATRVPDVERTIGKLTRSLQVATEVGPKADPLAVDAARPTPRTQGQGAEVPRAAEPRGARGQQQQQQQPQPQQQPAEGRRQGDADGHAGEERVEVQRSSESATDRDRAATIIEDAVRRMGTVANSGGAVAAATSIGDSLRELMTTLERAAEHELRGDLEKSGDKRKQRERGEDGSKDGEHEAREEEEAEGGEDGEDGEGGDADDQERDQEEAAQAERAADMARSQAAVQTARAEAAASAGDRDRDGDEDRDRDGDRDRDRDGDRDRGGDARHPEHARGGREHGRRPGLAALANGRFEMRGLEGAVSIGPRGFSAEGRIGAISLGADGARASINTPMGSLRFDGAGIGAGINAGFGAGINAGIGAGLGGNGAVLEAQLADGTGPVRSALSLDRDSARFSVDGPFGSLRFGPDGIAGHVTGIGAIGREGAERDHARGEREPAGERGPDQRRRSAEGGARADGAEGKAGEVRAPGGKSDEAAKPAQGARSADGAKPAEGERAGDKDGTRAGDDDKKGRAKGDGDKADDKASDKAGDKAGDDKKGRRKADDDDKDGPRQAGDDKKGAHGKPGDAKDDNDAKKKKGADDGLAKKQAGDRAGDRPQSGQAQGGAQGLAGAAASQAPRGAATLATAARPARDAAPAPSQAAPGTAQAAPRPGGGPSRAPAAAPPPRSTAPAVVNAPAVPSQSAARPGPGGAIEQPSFQITAQGRTPPTPQVPPELANPGAAQAGRPAAPMAAQPAQPARPQPGAAQAGRPGAPPAQANPRAATPQPRPGQPAPTAQPAAPAQRAREHAGPARPANAGGDRAPARGADAAPAAARAPQAPASRAAGVQTPAAAPHPSQAQPVPPARPAPAGATAAPRAPNTPSRAPDVAPVRPASGGGQSAPSPAGMAQRTVSLDGDRSAARSSIAAESETKREVPQQAAAAKQSQVAPLGPELQRQVPTVEAPARQAAVSQGNQRAGAANQEAAQRAGQAAAQAHQQATAHAQHAAQERAGIAGEPPPGIIAAKSPEAMGHVAQHGRAEVTRAAAPPPAGQAAQLGASLGAAGVAATARLAARTELAAAADLGPRAAELAAPRPLAPVEVAGAAQAQAAAAGQFAQARTALEQQPQVPEINLPGPVPAAEADAGAPGPAGAQGRGRGQGADAGLPSRGAAIATVEAGVSEQMKAQAPAQLAQGHAALAGEARGHLDRTEQESTRSLTDAATQAETGTQAAQQTMTATSQQAQAQAQAESQQHRAQGQAQAQAAQAQAQVSAGAAQVQAQAESQAARSQRDAGVAQAQAGFEAEQAASSAQYTADHATAQQSFDARNQQAQSQLAAEQQQAQTQAQAEQVQAKAKTDADVASERAANEQRRTQAQSQHQQQVAQANTQADADQQRIQSDMDQQVQQTDNRMRTDVQREETRGQQEVDRNLREGEQGYQREIQSGEQQAEAERQRAESAAAAKRAEAASQKDEGGGGIFGKVVNWVKDRVNDLLDMAASIIEAARAAVMRIMEAARSLAMKVLEAARAAAMAALNAVKQAIQGLISAAAAAIRGLISAAAGLIRGVIQALSTALQGLVRALTTVLNTLVEAFQTFVNAALDGLIAAVSLIDKDLGQKLQQATQGFRDRFNQAMDGLQQNITEAGQRLEQGIQRAADKATAVVDQVEQQLSSAVTAIEQKAHQAVDTAFAVAEAAVNAAFDLAEAGVNAAFDLAEAAVNTAFDVAQAAVEGYRAAFNAVCDAAVELADRALTALGDLAAAVVDLLPDSFIEGFIDFWNGPWRSMIIVGLATIAAVAFTVATGGLGGPLAAMLVAGVIGGTITGTAYLGGELIARQGAIDLAENGKGIYVPNHGYVPIGPDGKPDLSGVPEDKREEVAGQLGPGGWAGSNFETGPDGSFQVGPDGKPVGRPSSEIANEAVLEGIQGFGEGFISAAMAAGGGAVGTQIGGMVAKRFASQAAQKVVTAVVSGGVEGVFDIASSGATTFWNTGFDAMQAGKSPGEAFREAGKASVGAMTDPGAIAASLANIGVSGAKARGLDNVLDARLTNKVVRAGADVVIDTAAETVGEAAGNFGYTLATTGSIDQARAKAAESFDPTKILVSAGMGAAGNGVNSRAEAYAARNAGGTGGTGTTAGDGDQSPGGARDTGASGTADPARRSDAPVDPRGRLEPDPAAVVDRANNTAADTVASQIPSAQSTSTRRTQDGVEVRAETPRGPVEVVVTSRPRTDDAVATTTVDTAGRHVIDVSDTIGDADVPRVVEREVANIEAQRRTEATEATPTPASPATRPVDTGGTAADVGAFRGDARQRDLPDLTPEGMQRQLADRGGVVLPPGVTRQGDNFVLPDGSTVTVNVGLARDGSVASYDSTPDGYAVTVSRRASDADVARAVAHELAEIHQRERGVPDGPDTLAPDGPLLRDAALSAHDHGRLAEMRVLATELGTNPNDVRARHELQALVDQLGLRDGRPDADARLDLVRPHLDPETIAAIEQLRTPQPLRLNATDVDAVAQILQADPRFTGDQAAIDKVLREARDGDPGALGELEAAQRWLAEGRTVEMLPEAQNAGRKNPDFRVDGQVVEIKTISTDIGDRGISSNIDSANNQIKKSGLGEQGAVDVQLHGDAANAPFADVDRQVRRQFHENRSRSLDRVTVYKDGVVAGEWVRSPDGTVTRRFPAADGDASPATATSPTSPTGTDGAGPTDRSGASSMVPNSTYRGDGTPPNRADVDKSVTKSVPRLAGHFDGNTVRVNQDGSLDLTVGGQTRNVKIEVVPADRMHSPTDVANFDLATNPATIRVAEGVDPHHVERALAHEVAEMTSIMRADAAGVDPAAPRPAGDTALTHHDLGRVAELRVLIVDADPSSAGEMHALLEHMGVLGSDPASQARRQQIEAELGHPLPVTPEQQRTFDEARRVYQALANDPYQGPATARAAWAARLSEDGIDVAGRRDTSRDDLSARTADPDAVRGVADPRHELPSSSVLPDQPTTERPYTQADRDAVTQLRESMARIAQHDQDLAARDRSGDRETSMQTADGVSDRRQQEVKRVRELLEQLQLGGTDPTYVNRRLSELEQLFPDVDVRQVRDGVTDRVESRRRAEEAHARADEARARNAQRQEDIIRRVQESDAPCVDRLVIGAGMAGLTNAATLPQGTDFPGVLMLGTADPIGQRNPAALWGQRAGSYDPHPLFGEGAPGATRDVVEDRSEFMHIGELNDAMDIARDRLGVAPYPGTAGPIEPRSAADGTWPDNGYRYRVPVTGPDGKTRYIYANNVDVTAGPGGTRMPNEGILARDDLAALRERGDLIGGNDMLNERGEGGGGDREGRVFVYSFGPTGAWAARHSSAELGADRVDWGGSGGSSQANQGQMDNTRKINRTQDAFNDSRVDRTTDPVLRMRPGTPRGVIVTFNGPNGSYDVHYNRVAIAMGFDANGPSGARGDQPSSGQLLDNLGPMQLDPDGNPTLQSGDGGVRVMGAAATSGPGLNRAQIAELRTRQQAVISQITADSPTADTAEFGGRTIDAANRSLALRDVSDTARERLSALSWPEFSRLRGMSPTDLDRVGGLPEPELRQFIDSLAPSPLQVAPTEQVADLQASAAETSGTADTSGAADGTRVCPEATANWDKVKDHVGQPLGAQPPEGYVIFPRDGRRFLRRRDAIDTAWPLLTVDEQGLIQLGSAASQRLSVSGRLAANLGPRPEAHQAHHLVPDAVVRDHPLFVAARGRGQPPHEVDGASNGIYLPETADARTSTSASADLPLHSGSHPRYSALATVAADDKLMRLKMRYGEIDNIPPEALSRAAAEVEAKMRDIARDWDGDRLQ